MSDQFENENVVEESVTDAAAATDETQVEPVAAEPAEVVDGELDVPETVEGELEAPAPEEGEVSDDDFFAEEAAPEVPAVDPAKVVTIQTTSSQDKYVEVDGPMAMVDLIHKAELQFKGDFQCILNGANIDLTTKVPGGSTVTIVGTVKGG